MLVEGESRYCAVIHCAIGSATARLRFYLLMMKRPGPGLAGKDLAGLSCSGLQRREEVDMSYIEIW